MIFRATIDFCISTLLSSATYAETINPTAIVGEHNKWRAEVGVQALSYSPKLAKSAQNLGKPFTTITSLQYAA